jgi:hypothetical protein
MTDSCLSIPDYSRVQRFATALPLSTGGHTLNGGDLQVQSNLEVGGSVRPSIPIGGGLVVPAE